MACSELNALRDRYQLEINWARRRGDAAQEKTAQRDLRRDEKSHVKNCTICK